MEAGRLSNRFMSDLEQEDKENSTSSTSICTAAAENGSDSPPPSHSTKNIVSASSPKKSSSRRAVQKRVVSVPIKEVEGSRLKGENIGNTPPSDSWAWRKYGQKPIKGSPYPRGYYRCSSSKGCPARKQVERSRVDPTMLLVTYSSEHNHPWPPPSRNHHHHHHHHSAKPPTKPQTPDHHTDPEPEPDQRFADLRHDSIMATDEFLWFDEMETTSSTVLESPIFAPDAAAADVGMMIPMREEDESLFADLGELPECSLVFGHRGVGPRVEIC